MCLELPVTEVEFDLCRVVMASRRTLAFVPGGAGKSLARPTFSCRR